LTFVNQVIGSSSIAVGLSFITATSIRSRHKVVNKKTKFLLVHRYQHFEEDHWPRKFLTMGAKVPVLHIAGHSSIVPRNEGAVLHTIHAAKRHPAPATLWAAWSVA
jgi:hypothetical protein